MPSDPLLAAAKAWNKRMSMAAGAGMNPAAVHSVMSADLKKVGMGGTALSGQEALAAVQSASLGKTVQQHSPSTSLLGLPGRAAADFGNIAKGLGVGLVHLLEHPGRDIKGAVTAVPTTLKGLGQATHDISDPGKALRDVAGTPYGKFIPGVTTASELTTSGGRKQILQHPGFVAADLLPYAGKILGTLAKAGKLGDVAEAGSVAESAAAHQISRTTLRAASEGIKKITGGRLTPQASMIDVLGHYQLLQKQSQLMGKVNEFAKGIYHRDITTGELSKETYTDMVRAHFQNNQEFAKLGGYKPFTDDPSEGFHQAALKAHARTGDQLAKQVEAAQKELQQVSKPRTRPGEMPKTPTFGQPQSWSEVSKIVNKKTGQFDLVRTGEEGWYVKARNPATPEAAREVLIARKDYKPADVTTPPDPRKVAQAQEKLSAAERSHQTHLDTPAPKPPAAASTPVEQWAETLNDKQKGVLALLKNPSREALAAASPEAAKFVLDAYRQHAKLWTYGWLADNGFIKTEMDHLNHMQSLPPHLQRAYEESMVNVSPLTDALGWLGKHPDFNAETTPWADIVMDKHMAGALYGKRGIWNWEPVTSPAGKFFTKLTQSFKTAMFLRPSMLINVSIGSLIKMIGEEGPQVLRYVKEGYDLSKAHSPVTLAGGLKGLSTDQIHAVMGSKTIGRLLSSVKGWEGRFMEHVTGVQKAMVFLSEHNKVAGTAGEQAAREAGMAAINRVFVTMDSMTPFERTVVKQILPFYGFQKSLINYLAKYPADHPFVTSTLSKIAEQESADWQSGIPQMFQQMFWLGNPDQNGNVKAVQVSAFNPFGMVGNLFSVSGLFQSINPVGKIALEHLGMTSKGTPELYPNLAVDPATGALVAKNPSAGGLLGVAESVVPQLRTIDSMIGWNNRLKSLKVQNPSAYRAYLAQSLGIPIPQTVNVPSEVAKHEQSLYKVSQRDVSAFIKTGDFSNISGYSLVPYQGKWWTPDQLQQWLQTQQQTRAQPGVNIKALLPPARRTQPSFAPQ